MAPTLSAPSEVEACLSGATAHRLALCPPVVTIPLNLAVLLALSARVLQVPPSPALLCHEI